MVNAVDLFAGAAVGGAFGPVFDVFREVVDKTFAFNPTLKSVKSTVDCLALLIPQIEDHNKKLGGNRQGEVEELKEKMEKGNKLIKELSEVNEWNCLKAHYTDQLVDLDESLKRLLEILQVQGVIDAKEGLALTKDISTDVKESLALTKDISTDAKGGLALLKETLALSEENRNQVVGFDDTLKAGLSDIQRSQEVMFQGLMSKLERNGMANKVESIMDAGALIVTLKQLKEYTEMYYNSKDIWFDSYRGIRGRISRIYESTDEKWAENKEVLYIPTEELKYFRVQLEEGVHLVRNCPKVLEWTDDLKSEYTNKFLHLNTTLDTLYNRLNGIHLFKWNCGKCAKSCVTTSIRDSPNIF